MDEQKDSGRLTLKAYAKEHTPKEVIRWLDDYVKAHGLTALSIEMIQEYYCNPGCFFELLSHLPSVKRVEKRPVRVIGTFYHRMRNGGAERVISYLIPIWHKMGYQVILLTDESASDDDYEIDAPYTRVCIPACDWKDAEKDYAQRAKALSDVIREYEIDTMIHHSWMSILLPWDMLVCQDCGCRFLIHVHGSYTMSRYAGAGFSRQFMQYPAVYALADGIVTLNEADRQFWQSANANVFCVANPTGISVPAPRERKRACRTMLWLARFDRYKQPMDALRIAHAVIQKYPGAKLYMVGGGNTPAEQVLEGQIKAYIAENNLDDAIILTGFQKNVEPYYALADVFLMTSAFEGFGMTILEAQSHGLPVVMYDLPYLTLTAAKKGADCVAMNDVQAAAQRVMALMDDEAHFAAKSQEAIDNALYFIHIDRAAQWKEIFASLEIDRKPLMQNGDEPNMDRWMYHLAMDILDEFGEEGFGDMDGAIKTYLYEMSVRQATSLCVRTWMKKIIGRKLSRRMRNWYETNIKKRS